MSLRQRKRRQERRQRHSANTPSARKLVAATGLTAGATLAMSGVAHAAPMTFTVGSLDDTPGAADCATATNTDCTLRQAIIDANNNAGADTIVFASGLTGTIDVIADPTPVTEALAVQGPGASQITVNGGDSYRTFYIDLATSYDPVSISGLTLRDGYAPAYGGGGAIFNEDADLTISNAVISGNRAYSGGGIFSADGDVTLTNSTISRNAALGQGVPYYSDAYGGGVHMDNGNLTVDRSTINDNDARDGGGIYSSSGDVTLTNTTISGNNAVNDDGGGVWVSGGALSVTASTVTGNYAATVGGGLQSYNGGYNTVENSIVSGNTAVEEPDTSDLGEVDELFDVAFSLIGVPANHVNDTVPGSNLLGVNPQLLTLTNNGGPTQTHLPADTSPVIDKGSAFGLTSDQRGLTRPVEIASIPNSTAAGADGSDMGAVEVQSIPTTPTTTTPTTPVQPAPPKKKKCKKKGKKGSAQSAKKKCKKKKKK